VRFILLCQGSRPRSAIRRRHHCRRCGSATPARGALHRADGRVAHHNWSSIISAAAIRFSAEYAARHAGCRNGRAGFPATADGGQHAAQCPHGVAVDNRATSTLPVAEQPVRVVTRRMIGLLPAPDWSAWWPPDVQRWLLATEDCCISARVAVDSSGNVFIRHRRQPHSQVDAEGIITTVAGTVTVTPATAATRLTPGEQANRRVGGFFRQSLSRTPTTPPYAVTTDGKSPGGEPQHRIHGRRRGRSVPL
jgi:hypothetical protein